MTVAVYEVNPSGASGKSVFVGLNAGNTTMSPAGGASYLASANYGFGHDVLYSLTTGYRNVGIGESALGQLTTGHSNIGIGSAALASNIGGDVNVAIGYAAMYRNTTGSHNSAVGLQALYNNITGRHNTAVGRDAGFSNTTADWNSNFGTDAGPGITTGHHNTNLGGEAGYTEDSTHQNVTGSYQVNVGAQSGPVSSEQLDNAIAIGYRAKSTKSNQAVIGNSDVTEIVIGGVTVTTAQITALLALI